MSDNLKEEQSPRWQRFKDWGEFVFALVLTIYGVLGYYAVREQLDLTWRQIAITQDQIIDASRSDRRARNDIERSFAKQQALVDATTTMAQEFQKQTTQSRDALRLDQRAWVGIGQFSDQQFTVGQIARGNFVLLNSGRTPALSVQVRSSFWYVPPGAKPFYPEIAMSNVKAESTGTFFPGASSRLPISSAVLVTNDIADAVTLNTGALYIYVWVTYNDIFNHPHITKYCGKWRPDLGRVDDCGFGNFAN